jgi:hypothetical protein
MSQIRKRRKDAVSYQFDLYGCSDYLMKVDGKVYAYESVIVREARKVAGYTQPTYSLYRDLHKSASSKEIHGVRAICLEDFNAEEHLCTVHMYTDEGKNALLMTDEI